MNRLSVEKIHQSVGDSPVISREAAVYADIAGGTNAAELCAGLVDDRGRAFSPTVVLDNLAYRSKSGHQTIIDHFRLAAFNEVDTDSARELNFWARDLQESGLGPNPLSDELFPIAADMLINTVRRPDFIIDASLIEAAGDMICDADENGDVSKISKIFTEIAEQLIESAKIEAQERDENDFFDDWRTSYVLFEVFRAYYGVNDEIADQAERLITDKHFKDDIEKVRWQITSKSDRNVRAQIIGILMEEKDFLKTDKLGELASELAENAVGGNELGNKQSTDFVSTLFTKDPDLFIKVALGDANVGLMVGIGGEVEPMHAIISSEGEHSYNSFYPLSIHAIGRGLLVSRRHESTQQYLEIIDNSGHIPEHFKSVIRAWVEAQTPINKA